MSDYLYHGEDFFNQLKKDPEYILYTWEENLIYEGDIQTKDQMFSHWFYNPKNDTFFKFNSKKEYSRDILLSEEEGMEEPMHFFEYRDKSFQLVDASDCYERFLILAVIERLKVLGFSDIKFIEKNKKRSYRIKFSNKEDYSFFKVKFNELILL
jgi:hypothetical protein